MDISQDILSKITVFMKYSRFIPDRGRRETWDELIDRNMEMHIRRYPELADNIRASYEYVRTKKVLPSMRSLQFAGKPIEISPNRVFNCAYLPIDDWRAFAEVMFLLLGGTGVGYSVQNHHIESLPEINRPKDDRARRFLIGDSIEGWSDAISALMKSYFFGGSKIKFDFSDIRPKGARLVTSGGKAPGPQPLKECLVKIEGVLSQKDNGDKLSAIEVHDIICHIADAVLAGGIRRAALISLFSADDENMLAAKAGAWWELNPQRGRANNSVVLMRHKIDKEFFISIWNKIKASGAGEPGIYFSNDKDWGTNPSLRSGTKVWTSDGIFPIEQLENTEFFVKNLDGDISKAKCFKSGINKRLYKITLVGNKEYYATPEHEWAVWDGVNYVKVRTDELNSGDLLPIIRSEKITDGHLGTYGDGFYIGWQLGDGWLSVRKDDGSFQHGLIVSTKDDENGISKRLEEYLHSLGLSCKFSERGTSKELNINATVLNDNMELFGFGHKSNGLPTTVWSTASEEFRRGLIDGLFSSDGHVEIGRKCITLTSKHKKLLDDVQELLGFYGVKSSIRISESKLKEKFFIRYDLHIKETHSIKHFRNLFKLSVAHKQQRLDDYQFRDNIKNTNQIEIVDVELTDVYEDVWDISVMDHTHCFQISNCITGNCCEIALRPFEFCNLTEVNVGDVESQDDLNSRVKAAAFIGTLQAGYTDFHYLRPVWSRVTEKDALIGVSMTGIGSNKLTNLNIREAANVVKEENKRVAGIIGINAAARCTTIKPAGTTSLVLGCSSGIHAWHNDYYIRRMRVGKNESIYKYLAEYHPELIEDEYFRPHDTAVITVPQKAPDGAILRTESPIQLLERVKSFYGDWIKPGHRSGSNTHNISATISIRDHEWAAVGEWMWENRNCYNGLSVLPFDGGTYIQAPFEDCTEEVYNSMMRSLSNIDLDMIVEMEDNTDLSGELACSADGCEIK